MEFTTRVETDFYGFKLSHSDSILLLGSCFSQNINKKLSYYGFYAFNPFGAIYNPMSILSDVRLLFEGTYPAEDAFFSNDVWQSYDFHSDYSMPDRAAFLQNIDDTLSYGQFFTQNCSTVFISLGTAFFYILKSSGKIVANCHKTPAAAFDRQMLSIEDCTKALDELVTIFKNKRVIFTISPIRHLKDGLHQNQLSKAVLLTSVDKVCKKNTNCFYFPAYEIVLDELRDYRYYAEDMAHLSQTAVDYVWERFCEAFFTDETMKINAEVEKFRRMQNHRIINPESETGRAFAAKIETTAQMLKAKYRLFID